MKYFIYTRCKLFINSKVFVSRSVSVICILSLAELVTMSAGVASSAYMVALHMIPHPCRLAGRVTTVGALPQPGVTLVVDLHHLGVDQRLSGLWKQDQTNISICVGQTHSCSKWGWIFLVLVFGWFTGLGNKGFRLSGLYFICWYDIDSCGSCRH